MNTILKSGLLLGAACSALMSPTQAADRGLTHAKTHNVRMMRNEDGSFTEFSKSSDERVITRKNYSDSNKANGERVLRMSIIYRKDVFGKLRSGRIHDGTGKILYRVVYGYHKETGRLVAENMFDARVKRTQVVTDPDTGKAKEVEMPVRKLFHRYDAQGRRAKPIVFTLPAGKLADELFGPNGSSYLDKDPFQK